jgi:plastocyanin
MRYLAILAIVFGLVFATSLNNAEAQLTGNKAFTLSGNGFTVSNTMISNSNIEITFSTTQTKSEFALQNGVITLGQNDWNIDDFSITIIQSGKLFKFNAKAIDPQGKRATINAIGKLVDKTSTDSVYTLSGTLTDSTKKITKLVYTSKISEFETKPTNTVKKSDITIKILKGAANPQEITYKSQISGFKFNFLSEDRVTISPGTTITFLNEDVTSHSLKSGTANYNSHKKSFTADGKISSGDIASGESWSTTFNEQGFFRLFDEKYQHIDVTIFVIDSSKIQKTKTAIN